MKQSYSLVLICRMGLLLPNGVAPCPCSRAIAHDIVQGVAPGFPTPGNLRRLCGHCPILVRFGLLPADLPFRTASGDEIAKPCSFRSFQ